MYIQSENLGGNFDGRQMSILTTANIIGAFLGFLVAWRLSAFLGFTGPFFSLLWWMQVVLILGGIAVGVVLTTRWEGLSMLDRIGLFIGYQTRRLGSGRRLYPTTAITDQRLRHAPTVQRAGKVVVRPYRPRIQEDDPDG